VNIYVKYGMIAAHGRGEHDIGFAVNNFIYNGWKTDAYATNILCYFPKSGYKMEVFTGNINRLASNIQVFVEPLDPSGAILSRDEYKATGAAILTGSIFKLNPSVSLKPVASTSAKVSVLSSATFKQNWNFTTKELTLLEGATVTPEVTGTNAAAMAMSNYYWSTSDPTVVTVSPSGVITGVSGGTATITAVAKDDSYKMDSVIVTIPEYTVTFDAQDGNPVSTVLVAGGDKVAKPADPVKEGNTFTGWYNGTAAYDFNKAVNGNLKLTAKWTPTVYTVTFDSQGGTAKAAAKVNAGAKVAKPTNPTKSGSVFGYWALNGEAYDFNAPVYGNITLTAVWNVNAFTVTFNAAGGDPQPAIATVNHGATAPKPATDPVKDGFTFTGWYNGTTAYDFNKPVTANLTLTAKWTQIVYVVTFDSQGGTAKTAAKVNHGAKVSKPTNPIKSKSVFDGWYLNGVPYDFSAPVYSNMTLTAVWK
jgi:uncharacterized repeat protein (TIGR02543 family)